MGCPMRKAPAGSGGLSSFAVGARLGVASLLLVLAGTGLGLAADSSSDDCAPSAEGEALQNLPAPYAPRPDTSIVHTRVGGLDFYVPKNYFRHPSVGCGVEEPGMLLRVLLPDMEGYTEANAREIEGLEKPGWGRKMNIMIEARKRLRELARVVAGSGGPSASYTTQFGLLHVRSNRFDGGGPRTETDVLFEEEDGTVKRFIVCDAVTAVPSPGCAHRFLYRGLRTQATYDRDHLAQWREIEVKVRSLLDRFGTRDQTLQ